jgi:hypothetical protein
VATAQLDEYCFRTLKHLLATGACQVHSKDVYYGHLVLRLIGCLVLFYASRIICKGRMTMEEMLFSLKHYWNFRIPLLGKATEPGGGNVGVAACGGGGRRGAASHLRTPGGVPQRPAQPPPAAVIGDAMPPAIARVHDSG